MAASSRAVDLPHEGFGSYFLDTFDRPQRVTACECERSSGATLAQVLLLANSDEIENKLADGDGRIAKLLEGEEADRRRSSRSCTSARSRGCPTDAELSATTAVRRAGRTDNSSRRWKTCCGRCSTRKEFMFNH